MPESQLYLLSLPICFHKRAAKAHSPPRQQQAICVRHLQQEVHNQTGAYATQEEARQVRCLKHSGAQSNLKPCSGVSSDSGENSEEEVVSHYRQTSNANVGNKQVDRVPDLLAELASRNKRSNLMDTINKLSAAKASQDKRSTLDQLFANPSLAQS